MHEKIAYPQWRMVQLTLVGLTLKGSNVLAPPRRAGQGFNPGYESMLFNQRWLENINWKRKGFASKMKTRRNKVREIGFMIWNISNYDSHLICE